MDGILVEMWTVMVVAVGSAMFVVDKQGLYNMLFSWKHKKS